METLENYKKIKVISVRGLNSMTRAIRFGFSSPKDGKEFSFSPGEFVTISVLGYGESPLTITTSPSELPEFEIAVRTVGNNTMALNRLRVGDTAYLRGPLGSKLSFENFYGRELVVIAGGVGLAPLRSLVRYLEENPRTVSKLIIVYGAKTPEELIFKEDLAKWNKFAEVYITVDKADNDWDGEVGRIPDVVKNVKISKDASVIICGPPVMFPFITKELIKKKISKENIYLMLERKMRCGIGKCQHCTCGDKYVCTDGPTLAYSDIENNWEALR